MIYSRNASPAIWIRSIVLAAGLAASATAAVAQTYLRLEMHGILRFGFPHGCFAACGFRWRQGLRQVG